MNDSANYTVLEAPLASVLDITMSEERLEITEAAKASQALRMELQNFHAKVNASGSVSLTPGERATTTTWCWRWPWHLARGELASASTVDLFEPHGPVRAAPRGHDVRPVVSGWSQWWDQARQVKTKLTPLWGLAMFRA